MATHNTTLTTTVTIKSPELLRGLIEALEADIFPTVTKEECHRCWNKQKHVVGILPVYKLCINCREEVSKWLK